MKILFLTILLSFSCFAQKLTDECGMTEEEIQQTGYVCYEVRSDGEIWVSDVKNNKVEYYKSLVYDTEEDLLGIMEIVY
jgi:hypothetical protein